MSDINVFWYLVPSDVLFENSFYYHLLGNFTAKLCAFHHMCATKQTSVVTIDDKEAIYWNGLLAFKEEIQW